MRPLIALIALLGLAALPATAVAATPPIEEYEEELPDGGGDGRGGNDDDGGTTGEDGGTVGDDVGTIGDSGPLEPAQIEALEGAGDDGAAAAELAQRTGPDRDRSEPANGSTRGGEGDDDAGLAEVVGNVAGGDADGMGIVLPIVLIATTALAAVAFVRARRGSR